MKNLLTECQNLSQFFHRFVIKAPGKFIDKPVLKIDRLGRKETLSFGQLAEKAQEFAMHLILKREVQPGDKIAILGKNRADWDIAFWGTILIGAIPVLIDPERKVRAVKNRLSQTEAKILIMADDYQNEESRQHLKKSAKTQTIEMTAYEKPGPINSILKTYQNKIRTDDTAVILCTSGTTGDPREVELTHRNLIYNLQGALETVKIGPKDKLGHILPPHHAFGLTVGKLLPLRVGATNIYTNKYHQITEFIKKEKITIFVAVPAFLTLLARKMEEELSRKKEKNWFIKLLDYFFPKIMGKMIIRKQGWQSLRFFVSGAAAVPKWVLPVFWKRGLKLQEGYGTTENSPVYGFNTNPKKLGSVGRPIPTLLVKIVDNEILLGGPCIMKGYYRNPEATQKVIEVDEKEMRWLYTGDLGYLDKDGYLFITGRKKYIIVLPDGKNVNPELVESALSQAEFVKEILVVPAYDSEGQETVKAIVFPNLDQIEAKNSPEELKELVWQNIKECQQKNQELSLFERVSSKEFLEIRTEEFAKTSTGKIKREVYLPK